MVAEMPRVLRSAFIDRGALLDGRWLAPLTGLLAQPAPPERPRTDGAAVAASRIDHGLHGSHGSCPAGDDHG